MSKKNLGRLKRATKNRSKIKMQDIHRLTIFRSSNHIYAQVMLSNGSEVLASASTRDSSIKEKKNGNIRI